MNIPRYLGVVRIASESNCYSTTTRHSICRQRQNSYNGWETVCKFFLFLVVRYADRFGADRTMLVAECLAQLSDHGWFAADLRLMISMGLFDFLFPPGLDQTLYRG